MRVLIIGATGRTGAKLVEQALERGHDVTALVRSTTSSLPNRSAVRLVHGDILHPARVRSAVQEQDAVLWALGPRSRKDDSTQSVGTRHLVEAMREYGVKRLVLLSAIGVGESKRQSGVFGAVLVPLFLKPVFADKERQEAIVTQSGLDWTLVRPSHLTQDPALPRYAVVTDFQTRVGWSIPRANVATFMLDALENREFVHRKPTLGGERTRA